MCRSGYHFCSNINDVFEYQPIDSRVCVVKASNIIIKDNVKYVTKYVTNTLELVSEIEISKTDRVRYCLYNYLRSLSYIYHIDDIWDSISPYATYDMHHDSSFAICDKSGQYYVKFISSVPKNIFEVRKMVDSIIDSLSQEEIDKIYYLYRFNLSGKVAEKVFKDIINISYFK
jgi:hypothetical protein